MHANAGFCLFVEWRTYQSNAGFCLFVDRSTYQCSILPIRWPKYIPMQHFAYSLTEVHTIACFCLFVDSNTYQSRILPILWPKYVPMHALACSLTQVAYIPMQHFAYSLTEVHTNACFCLFVESSTYQCRIVPIRWLNYTAMRDLATLWLKCRQSQGFCCNVLTEMPISVGPLLLLTAVRCRRAWPTQCFCWDHLPKSSAMPL